LPELIETNFRNIPNGATPTVEVGGTTITFPTASDRATGLEADIVSVKPSAETDRLDKALESRTFVVAGTTFL
jgi:hypothetical protein